MKVKVLSTRLVKPSSSGISMPKNSNHHIPLTVLDKVTFDYHEAIIYAFRPPTPPNSVIELGLRKALSEYREWAGRLVHNGLGDRVILLNDKGVKFVEATVDDRLDHVLPAADPSPEVLSLHPSFEGVEELVQVQLTRFACGSLVLGFTANHAVADGQATSNFITAWGKAARGLDMGPLPIHDRTIFAPRNPPRVEFEHQRIEYRSKDNLLVEICKSGRPFEDVVVNKVCFTSEFLAKLKARANENDDPTNKHYSKLVCLVAHLWRTISRARGLHPLTRTELRLSVNGRSRMNDPKVPNEYFGNVVLWAFPEAKAKHLLTEPLPYAAKLLSEAVSNVDESYFRSFIDFASDRTNVEGLEVTADGIWLTCPDIDVDSWLHFPFHELDFGGGKPYMFLPSYFHTEGTVQLLPSFNGDGSITVFLSLFRDHWSCFKDICYSIDD